MKFFLNPFYQKSSVQSGIEKDSSHLLPVEYARAIDSTPHEAIGSGSFGHILKITHGNQSKAAKQLNKTDIGKREAAILDKLSHPHIIHLEAHGNYIQQYYLILEYAAHGDLLNYLEQLNGNEQVDWDTKGIPWMTQISLAIAHLHQLRILHCDIKPENILLFPDNTAKLTDFGLAKTCIPDEGFKSTFCGSANYAAPELIRHHYFSEKTDIYAFGTTLWCIATCISPWYEIEEKLGDEPEEKKFIHFINIMKNKKAPYSLELPESIRLNPALKNIMQRCLRYFWTERPSAEEVVYEMKLLK